MFLVNCVLQSAEIEEVSCNLLKEPDNLFAAIYSSLALSHLATCSYRSRFQGGTLHNLLNNNCEHAHTFRSCARISILPCVLE